MELRRIEMLVSILLCCFIISPICTLTSSGGYCISDSLPFKMTSRVLSLRSLLLTLAVPLLILVQGVLQLYASKVADMKLSGKEKTSGSLSAWMDTLEVLRTQTLQTPVLVWNDLKRMELRKVRVIHDSYSVTSVISH